MKNLIFILLCLIVYNGKCQSFDVRKTRWGMTMNEVQLSEAISPQFSGRNDYGEHVIIYELNLDSRNVILQYLFENNVLVEVSYRYYFGNWQDTYEFKDRIYSLNNVFTLLSKKGYEPWTHWYLSEMDMIDKGSQFAKCQNNPTGFKLTTECVDRVQNCLNKELLSPKFKSLISIRYENARSYVVIKFPNNVEPNDEVYRTILAWVKFRSKVTKSEDF